MSLSRQHIWLDGVGLIGFLSEHFIMEWDTNYTVNLTLSEGESLIFWGIFKSFVLFCIC